MVLDVAYNQSSGRPDDTVVTDGIGTRRSKRVEPVSLPRDRDVQQHSSTVRALAGVVFGTDAEATVGTLELQHGRRVIRIHLCHGVPHVARGNGAISHPNAVGDPSSGFEILLPATGK